MKTLQCRSSLLVILFLAGCTSPVSGEFRLQNQTQSFSAGQSINTKVDMLWVMDNSPTMSKVQSEVRAGIQQFAQTYMQPTWDFRVATISEDAYLADPSFWQGPQGQTSFLTTVRDGTSNYSQAYFNGKSKQYSKNGITVPARSKHYYDQTSWVTSQQFPLFNSFEPSPYSPSTVTYNNAGTEEFLAAGMRIIDTQPYYGPNWATLLVGNHDGPPTAMCWDDNYNSTDDYMDGATECFHRDDPADPQYHIGPANCANPNLNNGETWTSQCVNTFANNSVHTGMPVISTIPPPGVPGDQNWTNQLIANMQINLSVSDIGNQSERPFQSVLEFINDNESQPTLQFFRPGSLRIIVFVGDEDDQSQFSDPNQYQYGVVGSHGSIGPGGGYLPGGGTHAWLIPENQQAPFICKEQYPSPNAGWFYPTADGNYCVDPTWLIPISTVKSDLDTYFHSLDGTSASVNPNYFVTAITTMNTAGLQPAGYNYIAQRYPALVNLVGNGSMTLDITQSDYTPFLNQIGLNILQMKAVFQLARAPASDETPQVWITHADGSTTNLTTNQFTISGTTLTITDLNVVLTFQSTDMLNVSYAPATVY